MKLFMPERVIFEPSSLKYPLGVELYDFFTNNDSEVIKSTSNKTSSFIPGITPITKYTNSKKTILITTMKNKKLDFCSPSADYQFSLVSNCPGSCEYCYLQTTQGEKPSIKVYVNLEDIFQVIKQHIKDEGITTFEVASLGDPLALEHITGSLAKTIEFFGELENAKLRVVTKFSNVDSLLQLKHNGNTRFRVSINTENIIDNFEHNTARLNERIETASKLIAHNYPIGFIVAPIMVYDTWEEDYKDLFTLLYEGLGYKYNHEEITFELIQHRFTARAKDMILQRFPHTKLDMDEEKRMLKWGRYGRFKYVYPKEQSCEIKTFISSLIMDKFPNAKIEYFT